MNVMNQQTKGKSTGKLHDAQVAIAAKVGAITKDEKPVGGKKVKKTAPGFIGPTEKI